MEGGFGTDYARSNPNASGWLERESQLFTEFDASVEGEPDSPAAHAHNPLPLTQAVQQRTSQRAAQMVLALGPVQT